MGLGWSEILLLGLAGILIFGKDLPQVARETGRVIHEIQRALREVMRF